DADATVHPFHSNTITHFTPPQTGSATSALHVTGMTGKLATVSVSVWIDDTADSSLNLVLIDPAGHEVVFYAKVAIGANLGKSCTTSGRSTFTDAAFRSIASSAAPHPGSFRSSNPLAVFKGESGPALNGKWQLEVQNQSGGTTVVLRCWS